MSVLKNLLAEFPTARIHIQFQSMTSHMWTEVNIPGFNNYADTQDDPEDSLAGILTLAKQDRDAAK